MAKHKYVKVQGFQFEVRDRKDVVWESEDRRRDALVLAEHYNKDPQKGRIHGPFRVVPVAVTA